MPQRQSLHCLILDVSCLCVPHQFSKKSWTMSLHSSFSFSHSASRRWLCDNHSKVWIELNVLKKRRALKIWAKELGTKSHHCSHISFYAAVIDFSAQRLIVFLPIIYCSGYQLLECLFEEVLTDLIGFSPSELLKGVWKLKALRGRDYNFFSVVYFSLKTLHGSQHRNS